MAQVGITVLRGTVVADPELKYTPNGRAVVSVRVADTPRKLDPSTNTWVDGTTNWVRVEAWAELAENTRASLRKGQQVIVIGHYVAENFEDKETGKPRTSVKLIADEICPSLRGQVATVEKKARNANANTGGNTGATTRPAPSEPDSDEIPF